MTTLLQISDLYKSFAQKEVLKDIHNIKILSYEGLLVDFAVGCDAAVIVRGLRAVTDFEYELQLAQTNNVLNNGVDTMFLTTKLEYAYLSSSTVKEVASYGGDISKFVPPYVEQLTYKKFRINRG